MIESLNREQLRALLGRTDQSIDIRVKVGELPRPTISDGKEWWFLSDSRIADRFKEFHAGDEMTDEDVRTACRSCRPAQPAKRNLQAELETAKARAKELEAQTRRGWGGTDQDFLRAMKAKEKVTELERLMQGGE